MCIDKAIYIYFPKKCVCIIDKQPLLSKIIHVYGKFWIILYARGGDRVIVGAYRDGSPLDDSLVYEFLLELFLLASSILFVFITF